MCSSVDAEGRIIRRCERVLPEWVVGGERRLKIEEDEERESHSRQWDILAIYIRAALCLRHLDREGGREGGR